MKTSERCIAQIKQWEGFTRLAQHLPGDRPGVITGGYGDTAVKPGQTFSEQLADAWLRQKLATHHEPTLDVALRSAKVITQGQYDALISFAYNIGFGDPHTLPQIEGLLTSTLLHKYLAGDLAAAAAEFPRWNHADGVILPGLSKRRAIERDWFLEGPGVPPIQALPLPVAA